MSLPITPQNTLKNLMLRGKRICGKPKRRGTKKRERLKCRSNRRKTNSSKLDRVDSWRKKKIERRK